MGEEQEEVQEKPEANTGRVIKGSVDPEQVAAPVDTLCGQDVILEGKLHADTMETPEIEEKPQETTNVDEKPHADAAAMDSAQQAETRQVEGSACTEPEPME